MATVIAFSNQKGGVAKTTSAVMTAANLTSRGYKTLLVDCDPQGSSTEYITSVDQIPKYSLYDLIVDEDLDTDDVIMHTDFGDIIPASHQLYDADKITTSPEILKEIVELVSEDYDYIIMDTPPNLGWLQLAALYASDDVVIPTRATKQSVQGISSLLDTIYRVKKTNAKLKIAGFLFTMSDPRVLAVKFVSEEVNKVADQIGCKVFRNQIRTAQGLFGEAELLHQNIFISRKKNNAINDYKGFVDELLEVINHG